MGGYRSGPDPDLDKAVQLVPRIYDVMRQSPEDPASVECLSGYRACPGSGARERTSARLSALIGQTLLVPQRVGCTGTASNGS